MILKYYIKAESNEFIKINEEKLVLATTKLKSSDLSKEKSSIIIFYLYNEYAYEEIFEY